MSSLHLYKKKHFSMIELLVAMTLTVLVLTTLSFFHRYLDSLNTQIDSAQHENFQLRYLENRLSHVFSRAIENQEKTDEQPPPPASGSAPPAPAPQTQSPRNEKKQKKPFYFFSSHSAPFTNSKSSSLLFMMDN